MRDEKAVIDYLVNLAQAEKSAAGAKPRSTVLSLGYDGGQLFKLGRLDRSTRKHNPPALSGDASVYAASDLMHRRTREMYANVAPVKRTVDVLRDIIVGSGINSFSDPIDFSFGWDLRRRSELEIWAALDYALESDEKFIDWATNPKLCDVSGSLTWFEAQALLISESALVGDYFIIEVNPKVPTGDVPFKFQIVEREQLDTSKDQIGSDRGNQILNGIEIDAQGYEVGAWFYDVHPHDSSFHNYKSTFVPSSRYTHFYKKMRPSQHIGATWLHANGSTMIKRNEYIETEIATAVKHALYLLAYKTNTPGSMDVGLDPEDGDQTGYDIALGQDPIAAEIGTDESLELLESARPNPNAGNFFNLMDHDHAAAANISYYSQTGRFNETNYGGFRGAMNLEDAQMEPIKNAVAIKAVLPVRRRWNDLAVATGLIESVTPAQYRKERKRFNRFDCIGPGRNLLDPEKENSAIVDQLRSSLATLKYACALNGDHWIMVLRQKKLETLVADTLGVVLDFSKGGGGSAAPKTESKEAPENKVPKTGTRT